MNDSKSILGWKTIPQAIKQKPLLETAELLIQKNSNEETIAVIKELPALSLEEETIIADVSNRLSKKESKISNETIEEEILSYCEEKQLILTKKQFSYLAGVLEKQVFGFEAIDSLLKDDSIEEIAINGIGEKKPVHVYEKEIGWVKTNLYFSSKQLIIDLANKMAKHSGKRITLQNPKLNSILANGSRLNAIIEPISIQGPVITIRKFSQKPFTPIDLIEKNTISLEATAFLWLLLETETNLLIAGNTGSGKTTTLNSLLSFIPSNERIIAIEETPEIFVPHEHKLTLTNCSELKISTKELIQETLRMRPDRVIVGEIRKKEEAQAFVDTLLAGQGKGSCATFHAQSTMEAITRMKKFGIEENDLASLDAIVIQKRWSALNKNNSRAEQRKIIEISAIEAKNSEITIKKLFEFDYEKNSLKKKGESKKLNSKLANYLCKAQKSIETELAEREKKLREMLGLKIEMRQFFEKIHSGELK